MKEKSYAPGRTSVPPCARASLLLLRTLRHHGRSLSSAAVPYGADLQCQLGMCCSILPLCPPWSCKRVIFIHVLEDGAAYAWCDALDHAAGISFCSIHVFAHALHRATACRGWPLPCATASSTPSARPRLTSCACRRRMKVRIPRAMTPMLLVVHNAEHAHTVCRF